VGVEVRGSTFSCDGKVNVRNKRRHCINEISPQEILRQTRVRVRKRGVERVFVCLKVAQCRCAIPPHPSDA